MMHMNTALESPPQMVVCLRAFALGTRSFGAFQNGRAHTAS